MPIILDDDSGYFVCGGPQIDPSTYKVILGDNDEKSPEEEENNGI